MGAFTTVTIELTDNEAATAVTTWLKNRDELVQPKQPNDEHVVVHSGLYPGDELEETIANLLGSVQGVSRVGIMHGSDTTDMAYGRVYWLDNGNLRVSDQYADEGGDFDEECGHGAIRRIRAAHDFEIYSWWDYQVEKMETRYREVIERMCAKEGDESRRERPRAGRRARVRGRLDDWASHTLGVWTPLDWVWGAFIYPVMAVSLLVDGGNSGESQRIRESSGTRLEMHDLVNYLSPVGSVAGTHLRTT